MNNNEKMSKANSLIVEAIKLLNEVTQEQAAVSENDTFVVLKKYIDYIDEGNLMYYMDSFSEIDSAIANFNEQSSNPYTDYGTKAYAIQAVKFKKFTDACLAFKWCWDRDYEPDWNNNYTSKFYIIYNNDDKKFGVADCQYLKSFSTVYFSTRDVAQKCADWLNATYFKDTEVDEE